MLWGWICLLHDKQLKLYELPNFKTTLIVKKTLFGKNRYTKSRETDLSSDSRFKIQIVCQCGIWCFNLDPKSYSVLNIHTQYPSFYPPWWSIPRVLPQLIRFCWENLSMYESIYWIIHVYPFRHRQINKRQKSVKIRITNISVQLFYNKGCF